MGLTLEQYFSQPHFLTPRRLILSIEGPQKVGKSTLGLTAMELGLTAMLDYDYGTEGVVTKFDYTNLWHLPLDAPHSMWLEDSVAHAEYKAAWKKAKDAYYAALGDARVKNILIDTSTEFRQAQLLSHFGRPTQIARMYTEPNGEFRKLIRDAYERPDLNLILVHTVKDEYVNDTKTGNYIPNGFKEVPGLVQMVVRMWKRNGAYGLTITDCRHKRELEGKELPAAIATFPMLLNLVHGAE